MEEDESVPISFEGVSRAEEGSVDLPPGETPVVRENVDAGVHVIDLADMRAQLESTRKPGG